MTPAVARHTAGGGNLVTCIRFNANANNINYNKTTDKQAMDCSCRLRCVSSFRLWLRWRRPS